MKGICRLLIALMIWAPYQVASAGMIATTQASAGAERAALTAELQTLGIDAVIAKERVAAMTDQEVQTLAAEIANAPAGGVYTEGLVFIIIASLIIWAWYKHRNPY
jgi:cell division protein FtsB